MSNAKLPHVKSGIPQDLRLFIDRVRDIFGGTGANKLITANDLISGRLATLSANGALSPITTDTYLATPPAPTSVAADGGIQNIVVSWDGTSYYGHAYSEVWGSATDDLGAAVLLGQTPGELYVDAVGPSTTRYYWVRFINREGTAGPYNATDGTDGTTGSDVTYTLGLLANQITTSELSSSLNSRINLIDGPATTIGTIPYYLSQIQGQIDAINSYPDYDNATAYATNDIVKYNSGLYKAIASTTGNLPTDTNYWTKIGDYTSIADAVVTIAEDLSTAITNLGVEVTDRQALSLAILGTSDTTEVEGLTGVGDLTTGLLYNEKYLRETQDGVLAGQITTVSATANGKNKIYRQDTAPASPSTNDIWVDTKISYSESYFDGDFAVPKYKQYQWDGTAWLDITDTEIYDNHAYFISEQTARISSDEAIVTSITQLEAQVNLDIGVVQANLTDEASARAGETGALATRATTLEASVFDDATGLAATRADLQTNYLTAADTNSAIASSKTILKAYADLGSRTFKTDTAPTIRGYDADTDPATEVPLQAGDVWIDTTDALNKFYVWSGTAWVYSPDGAVTGQISALESTLVTDYYTKTDIDGTVASQGSYLRSYADVQTKTFYQADAPTARGTDPETSDPLPLLTGDVWYDTNDSNKLYVYSGSAWVYSPDGVITQSVTDVDSRVTTVETTKIGYCTIDGVASDDTNKTDCEAAGGVWNVGLPLATAVKQVAISDGSTTASLEQRFTAQKTVNDTIASEYTLKIDDGGIVSGFGLRSEGGTSTFIASVNQFGVEAPLTSVDVWASSTTYAVGDIVRVSTNNSRTLVCKIAGVSGTTAPSVTAALGSLVEDNAVTWQVASRVPFAVQSTPATINGASVPAGVYIDAAYILNATVNNAQIANAAIDDAKIIDLSASKLKTGEIEVGQEITSTDYIPGTQGWAIKGNGTAEFQTAVVRGTVYATDGEFTGTVYATDGSFSGTVYATDGSFNGTVYATGGEFSGSLYGANITGATGTFTGTISASAFANALTTGETFVRSSPGTYTITVPSGKLYSKMRVTLVGGGGGGGGASATYDEGSGNGGGGGGGGLVQGTYDVTEGQSFELVVGTGGAGAAQGPTSGNLNRRPGPPGSAGTATILSRTGFYLSAGGGGGGGGAGYNGQPGSGGTGGSGTTYGSAGQASWSEYTYSTDPKYGSTITTTTYRAGHGGASGGNNGAGGAGGTNTRNNFTALNGKIGGQYGGGGGGGATGYNQGGCGGGGAGYGGYAIIEFYNPNGVVLRDEFNALIDTLAANGITFTYTP